MPWTKTGQSQLSAVAAVTCHDQAVANLSKIADRLDAVMDLMGPVIGVIALAVGFRPGCLVVATPHQKAVQADPAGPWVTEILRVMSPVTIPDLR